MCNLYASRHALYWSKTQMSQLTLTISMMARGRGPVTWPRDNVSRIIAVTHPTVTSKMLLPTELDTAMSPKPFLATITLVIRSGMDVPAARNVNPITWLQSYVILNDYPWPIIFSHLRGNAHCVARDSWPPNHQVRKCCYPQYTPKEGDREKLFSWNKSKISFSNKVRENSNIL